MLHLKINILEQKLVKTIGKQPFTHNLLKLRNILFISNTFVLIKKNGASESILAIQLRMYLLNLTSLYISISI